MFDPTVHREESSRKRAATSLGVKRVARRGSAVPYVSLSRCSREYACVRARARDARGFRRRDVEDRRWRSSPRTGSPITAGDPPRGAGKRVNTLGRSRRKGASAPVTPHAPRAGFSHEARIPGITNSALALPRVLPGTRLPRRDRGTFSPPPDTRPAEKAADRGGDACRILARAAPDFAQPGFRDFKI